MKRFIALVAAARERLRTLFFRARIDSELDEELRFHVDMEASKLADSGVSPAEARRRAAATFGGVERFKDEVRSARGLAWIPGTRLDFMLGLRMMKKHPALSIVGGFGMAVGVAMSAGMFVMLNAELYAILPLDEGDRIVSIENRDIRTNDEERQLVHEFVEWRGELKSVVNFGAYRTVARNVSIEDGTPDPTDIAEMSAAGFAVARVAPLMGRYLVDDDERVGAPPVVVIGHGIWNSRFGARPDVVGRSLRIAGVNHTVVGVMPDGFRFPFSHDMWIPFRANPLAFARHEGPVIYLFGRLAPGATLKSAQAELTAIGARTAAAYPENAKLTPFVMPYAQTETDNLSVWIVVGVQTMMSLLLIVISLNVAMLVYARTAMRHGEIAVRTALGASRRRIVTQLFIEALVLSLSAAAVGLVLAIASLRFADATLQDDMSRAFWRAYDVEPLTVVFTVGIAVLAAVIVGVIPALQATGKQLQSNLRGLSGSAMRLGRTWTILVIAQVAIAVAVLPGAISFAWNELRGALTHYAYDADHYVTTTLHVDATDEQGRAVSSQRPFSDRVSDMLNRIGADPLVAGVTYGANMPGRNGRIELEGEITRPDDWKEPEVYSNGVAQNYFDMYGTRFLAGRGFVDADLDSTSTSVVVNRAFVDHVLSGAPALGRRVRYAAQRNNDSDEIPASRWYDIVGVVENSRANEMAPDVVDPELYYGVSRVMSGGSAGLVLEVHMRGDNVTAVASRMREIAANVDPLFRLGDVLTQSTDDQRDQLAVRLIGGAMGIVLIAVFLLSAAGVYALVSFTITRRRKEIGIRSALGASQRQVLVGVLGPVARQIAIGIVIGIAGAAVLDRVANTGLFTGRAGVLLPVFGVLMSIVALVAAFGPARRGLNTQPTEALRAEA